MTRQILDQLIKLEELADARVRKIETRVTKLPFTGILRIFPFPCMNEPRKTRKRCVVESERLAAFSRRGTAAISDDVSGHRRAQFSVALVNVLNRFLALVSAR